MIVERPGVGLRVAGRPADRRGEGDRQRLRGAEVVEVLDGDRQRGAAGAGLGLGRRQVGVEVDRRGRLRRDGRAVDLHRHQAGRRCRAAAAGSLPLGSAGQPSSTSARGRAQVAVGVRQERAGRGQHERQVGARRPADRGDRGDRQHAAPGDRDVGRVRGRGQRALGLDVPDRVGPDAARGEPAAAADGVGRARSR